MGVMFTFMLLSMIIIIAKNVDSMPLRAPKQLFVSQTDGKDCNFDFKKQQHLAKFRETDKTVLWFAVAITGIFAAFVMIICPCTVYCCASWEVLRTAQSNLNRTSWSNWILRKLRSQRKRTGKDSNDLPPSYEVILAIREDQLAFGTILDEEPPSYTDALLMDNKNGAF